MGVMKGQHPDQAEPAVAPDLEELLRQAASALESGGLLRLVRMPARTGQILRPDPPLPEPLRQRLEAMGIRGLWSHQAEALAAVRRGENVIVSTGTASGKSLCFNLPVIERIHSDDRARALYLYPTKALAQDQLRAIRAFALPQLAAAAYDGDTPQPERPWVRRYANIVLSNPDMLHFGILPQHARWAELLSHLAFVVVDEAHVLRGVFGSHVGCILRRLRRVVRHYGAEPTFVLASATIGNPGELAERLVGAPVTPIVEDGSPRGDRLFAFWNPPFLDDESGVRASSNWESARLLATLVDRGIHSIAFAKSRKAAELVARYAKQMVTLEEAARRIRPYRAGYLASDRREIEQQLFSGELLGVAATSALELGIDVAGLGAVVINGFPGTVAQVWQQSGRAGRAGEESVTVLVGQDDPLDQYYLTHPDVLLAKPFEAALVDTCNPRILEPHLACAAFELPIETDQVEEAFGEGAGPVADRMEKEGALVARTSRGRPALRKPGTLGSSRADIRPPLTGRRLHWARRQPPGRDLDIRSLGGPAYSIVEADSGALLGTVDGVRAFHHVHPGAIYLHQGENLEVVSLDRGRHVALVVAAAGDYYTQAREISDVRILEPLTDKRVGAADLFLGRVEVTERVVGFARRTIATGEVQAIVDLDLPEQVLETVAVWYAVGLEVITKAQISPRDLPGALHAAEHAAIGVLPIFAMADRWDIGGMSTALAAGTGLPTVFIYDGYPGGVGIAERGYAAAGEHLRTTLEVVRECLCERGCPSCVQSPKCGNGNEPLDKDGAVRLLREILR